MKEKIPAAIVDKTKDIAGLNSYPDLLSPFDSDKSRHAKTAGALLCPNKNFCKQGGRLSWNPGCVKKSGGRVNPYFFHLPGDREERNACTDEKLTCSESAEHLQVKEFLKCFPHKIVICNNCICCNRDIPEIILREIYNVHTDTCCMEKTVIINGNSYSLDVSFQIDSPSGTRWAGFEVLKSHKCTLQKYVDLRNSEYIIFEVQASQVLKSLKIISKEKYHMQDFDFEKFLKAYSADDEKPLIYVKDIMYPGWQCYDCSIISKYESLLADHESSWIYCDCGDYFKIPEYTNTYISSNLKLNNTSEWIYNSYNLLCEKAVEKYSQWRAEQQRIKEEERRIQAQKEQQRKKEQERIMKIQAREEEERKKEQERIMQIQAREAEERKKEQERMMHIQAQEEEERKRIEAIKKEEELKRKRLQLQMNEKKRLQDEEEKERKRKKVEEEIRLLRLAEITKRKEIQEQKIKESQNTFHKIKFMCEELIGKTQELLYSHFSLGLKFYSNKYDGFIEEYKFYKHLKKNKLLQDGSLERALTTLRNMKNELKDLLKIITARRDAAEYTYWYQYNDIIKSASKNIDESEQKIYEISKACESINYINYMFEKRLERMRSKERNKEQMDFEETDQLLLFHIQEEISEAKSRQKAKFHQIKLKLLEIKENQEKKPVKLRKTLLQTFFKK